MTALVLRGILRLVFGFVMFACCSSGACQDHENRRQFNLRDYSFQLPEGFHVELVAESPLVKFPICGDFDEQGHFYVAESSGARDWNQPQPTATRHRVLRLSDVDGDGRFDKRTIFAELEMLPQGSMWLDGSLYVAAAPIIWKLTDRDGDGVADKHETWVTTDEVTGCLNDLRGPYLGPDGWIYWCKGAGSEQTYHVDGQPWSTTARHVFRRHPNRMDVEYVMIGGMDNPVEVAFARSGEMFVSSTNIQMLTEPRRDGILHVVNGGIYPKDISPVYQFPWSGPDLMPALVSWGALSPCGLARYESDQFGESFRDNLFCTQFSGHAMRRYVLRPDGATFTAGETDFLYCDNVKFHPTDVIEDADGSLLVIETGGWYLHCCPSSTFYRPDQFGAIYRIRRDGAHQIDDPRGLKLPWGDGDASQFATRLGDPRPAVQRRAMEALGKRESATSELQRIIATHKSSAARLSAVWAATRIDDAAARELVRYALNDSDETVRHAALASISLWKDRQALPDLLQVISKDSNANRRVAAEALGRIGEPAATKPILETLGDPVDRFLAHSLTLALIQIGDAETTRAALDSDRAAVRRVRLLSR